MGAITAHGTTISVDSSVVGYVTSISAASVSVATIDSTDLDDTWRTFIGGLRDGGECTFEIAYNPLLASHAALEADIDGAAKDIVVTWSDATTCEFSAIITSFSVTAAMDAVVTASLGMKISAAITFPA